MSIPDQPKRREHGISRRSFLKGVGGAVGGVAVSASLVSRAQPGEADAPGTDGLRHYPPDGLPISLAVNGTRHEVHVAPAATLLTVLRERLKLTGSKEVCDRGACGACTVLVNGRAVNSCMMLAVDAEGASVTTIEGLAASGEFHPIQKAFAEHDACQCGYCIPGFIMRTHALLLEHPAPTLPEIRRGLAGNICRCGTYEKIFQAVRSVRS